ncbi:50S ribosomal protein L34e [Candidatus Woesearchaeota archaeon]|nr:hypothetical protein [uncultured archaeon]AQS32283.1 hypothetical protein [uncultured archaeon]MBS3149398.1 50S ribosomal protein L34e [Candidatus Woesearchaeota archaeon]
MLSPSKTKSRTFKRKKVKTPGGKIVIHYERRVHNKKKCANCKKELHGIPRKLPYKYRTMSKSKKTVNRLFGGYLCSNCSREKIKEISRNVNGNR